MTRIGDTVANEADLRAIVAELAEVEEISSEGFDFRTGGKGFVWSWPERVPGKRRVIRTDVAVLFVGDEAEKQALVQGEPELFFTTASYDRHPLVMVRLDAVTTERLRELLEDAWHMRRDPDGPPGVP